MRVHDESEVSTIDSRVKHGKFQKRVWKQTFVLGPIESELIGYCTEGQSDDNFHASSYMKDLVLPSWFRMPTCTLMPPMSLK